MEETRYRPPSILRLPGITLKEDYISIEDFADKQLLLESHVSSLEDPAHESILPLDKIPRVFTGLEDWPHETNLRCWSCGYTFKGPPVFVPKDVRESESGGIEFGVLGNMCSFPCSELWISIHFAAKEDQRWRAQDNLCLVYLLFTGRHVARILPAPDKTELQKYGGDLDEDTFFQKIRRLDPLTGSRDHINGIIGSESIRTLLVPKSLRVKTALAKLRGGGPVLRAVANTSETSPANNNPGDPLVVGQKSVWRVCGLPFEACADSIAITPLCMNAPELLLTDCAADRLQPPKQMPACSKQTPAGSKQTPAGSKQTPAGSKQTPAGSKQTPAGSKQTPAGSKQTPAGSKQTPAGSKQTPAGSKSHVGPKESPISNSDMDDLLAELGVFEP